MTKDTELKSTDVMNDGMRLTDEMEKRIYMIITKNNRTSMKQLGHEVGLTGRQVRKKIEMIRRNGVRIGSDEKGYFICKDEQEFNDFIKRYTATAYSIVEIAKAMKNNNNEQVMMNEPLY